MTIPSEKDRALGDELFAVWDKAPAKTNPWDHVARAARRLVAEELAANGGTEICEGCGSTRSLESIQADGYRSCCPERKMFTAKQWAQRAEAAEAENKRLREALLKMLLAVCGPTGFAAAVRNHSGLAYPWEGLDIAEANARAALSGKEARDD